MTLRTSPADAPSDLTDPLAGVLLGTALGDALGLPAEMMSAHAIARRFGRVERFHLLGSTGFVSDDTEQTALVAHSLARHPDEPAACVRAFRRALLAWFLRLPWGLGLATLKACLRILLGLHKSGVHSAGNGAAMRAAVIGVFFHDDPAARRRFGLALAEVTHLDPRAQQGALYVAEVAAAAARRPAPDPAACVAAARPSVTEPCLAAALDRAMGLAQQGAPLSQVAEVLGTTGFVLHTVPFATYCFLRHGQQPLPALSEAISAGGDTDSIGAILGAWIGTLHGAAGLPADLLGCIHDGPFGPSHLRALAQKLAAVRAGEPAPLVRYSAAAAMLRNLLLYPVILAHGLRRLFPV